METRGTVPIKVGSLYQFQQFSSEAADGVSKKQIVDVSLGGIVWCVAILALIIALKNHDSNSVLTINVIVCIVCFVFNTFIFATEHNKLKGCCKAVFYVEFVLSLANMVWAVALYGTTHPTLRDKVFVGFSLVWASFFLLLKFVRYYKQGKQEANAVEKPSPVLYLELC